jgi:predicted RecB family nuclease
MAGRISIEVIEAYLSCKYKARLIFDGEVGPKSEFELFEARARADALSRAQRKFAAASQNVTINKSVLAQGTTVLVGARLEEDDLYVRIDALQKAEGRSALGTFYYLPLRVVAREKIQPEHKMLLAIQGVVLGRLQGKQPTTGLIVHGRHGKLSRIKLPMQRAEAILTELGRLETAKLVLNEHCRVCEFQGRCNAQATKDDHISLLRGLSEKDIKNYNRRGIFTLTQLSCDFHPRRGKHKPAKPRHYPALQAIAIRDKKVLVVGAPELPDCPVRIYLDLEGDPDRGVVYLMGLLVDSNGIEQRHSFWIDDGQNEAQLFHRLAELLTAYSDYRIFHYGSYETVFLRRLAKVDHFRALIEQILPRCVNVLSVVYHNVYFPTHSNGLKDIGQCLGYSWAAPSASGIQSLLWRRSWEEGHDAAIKRCLLEYNQEDCAALKRVTEFIRRAIGPATSCPEVLGPDVATVQDLNTRARKTEWNRRSPFFPDFDFINKCAYFDYQRERVFVRTNRTLLRLRNRRKPQKRKIYRINKKVEFRMKHCPVCGRLLHKLKDQVLFKLVLDLRITSGGISRRVTKCSGALYRCARCKWRSRSPTFLRIEKHGHALKSWALNQHVAYRASIDRVSELFAELFGIRLHAVDLTRFKELAAAYYEPTYNAILARILSGPLLHADETSVKLRDGTKGYVWVFTSVEEAVYFYRPNREGRFLQEMLKNFKGVLVSDFYGAYDSLACPQQKCLVHLMRDLNNDLLRSPFDEEFKGLVSAFSGLLKAIVTTIDQHGLKLRSLGKHRKHVDSFFKRLSSGPFRSEVAENYRGRFLRHRETLFTFLNHDGVPWNNSNAEHAIRRFAFYRAVTVATLSEAGLRQYLLLLSILQTCKCKGLSFLSFLLSGDLDIAEYAEHPKKRKEDAIAVYPDWFIENRRDRRKGKEAQTERASPVDVATTRDI